MDALKKDTKRNSGKLPTSPTRLLSLEGRHIGIMFGCECNVLELHYWLQNFTVPNSIEPKCKAPPRLSGEEIKSQQQNEFACIPEVSPTTMFLEVVVGKNMSLICNVEVSLQ